MIQEVIGGVVAALAARFGGAYPYYTDRAKQGLVPGSFLVTAVRPTQAQFLGSRYLRRHPICVYYFPKSEGDYAETNGMIEALFSALEMIEVSGEAVRGTNMEPRVEDGTLCFLVSYDFFVRRGQSETVYMEEIQMKETIHGKES